MPFSPQTLEEKPYNLCLNCAHIGKKCDGPNFLAMEMPRLCEWCRLRKEYLHGKDLKWTNAFIAEQSGLSKVSVDRFLSGNVDDIKISTIAKILKVLVNGSWGQYPCVMAANSEKENVFVDNPILIEKADNAIAQCRKLQEDLATMKAEHKDELAAAKADEQRRLNFLKDQIASKDKLLAERYDFLKRKDKIILCLAVLLGVAVLTVIAFLVADALDPTKGFFWITSAFNNMTSDMPLL